MRYRLPTARPRRAARFALPLALAATLVALPAGVVGAGCATLGGANYVSLDQEWEMGRQLEAEVNGQVQLVNDATLQRYVENLGQRLVAQTTMSNLPWRFHVVRDARINAFNIPGGVVYVNTGLIAQSGSAAEFVGALAHEIGHGIARHGTQRMSAAQETNVLATLILGRNPGQIAQVAAQVAATGAFARFSRADEREADQLGVQIMAGAGYNPEGLARLLERLMQEEGSRSGVENFFATHPTSAERVANVRAMARAHGGGRTNDDGFNAARTRAQRYN